MNIKLRRPKDDISCCVLKPNIGVRENIPKVPSTWSWEHWKRDKRSGGYWLNDEWEETNVVTDEGVTHMMDVTLSGGAQKTTWYIALFNDNYTPLITNTYQSPGYTESTNYDEGSRVEWQEAGVTAKSMTNSANRSYFTMNATEEIFGASLVSASTKGDTVSGEVLYCSSSFNDGREVDAEDIIKVTVTLAGQDV